MLRRRRVPSADLSVVRDALRGCVELAESLVAALSDAERTYPHRAGCPRGDSTARLAGRPCGCDQPARMAARLAELREETR